MVQEHTYNSSIGYVADLQDSKTTYKAMVTGGFTSPQATPSSSSKNQNKNKKSKIDVWGPIYKDRQHFVDMHIC